jgi:DNA-binding SARP family transcriptional activator
MEKNSHYKTALLFLGPPRLLLGGEDASGRIPAKHLALVAYLAARAPEHQARNTVAGLLWSETSDEASLYRLRHALWEIRRAFGDDLLKSDNRSCWLCIDNGVKVDVLDFKSGCKLLNELMTDVESLQGLVEIYRGDLLEGLTVREAPLFEEWLLSERERLNLSYLDALWYLSRAQITAGKLDEAILTLNQLIEADPLRERGYRALMGVHLRRGDKTAALQVYSRCVDVLNRELGIDPSPATERVRRMALQEAPESAGAELDRAAELLRRGNRQEAWDICAAVEASASDPAVISQAALLRAEIALAEGKPSETLGLVRAARQALGRLFGN